MSTFETHGRHNRHRGGEWHYKDSGQETTHRVNSVCLERHVIRLFTIVRHVHTSQMFGQSIDRRFRSVHSGLQGNPLPIKTSETSNIVVDVGRHS
jgi:hypothetical protein